MGDSWSLLASRLAKKVGKGQEKRVLVFIRKMKTVATMKCCYSYPKGKDERKKKMTTTGEGFSNIAERNASWYNHLGKLFGRIHCR